MRGVVSVREPVRVWPVALPAPVQVTAGQVAFDGPALGLRPVTDGGQRQPGRRRRARLAPS